MYIMITNTNKNNVSIFIDFMDGITIYVHNNYEDKKECVFDLTNSSYINVIDINCHTQLLGR